jgi:hypothetical protein
MITIDEQYTGALRHHNTDAPLRSSTSLQSRRTEPSGFAAYNQLPSDYEQSDDELVRYKSAPEPTRGQDPLRWWTLHEGEYPVLKT